eukprot:12431530-Karenia_brevis.AAC.4
MQKQRCLPQKHGHYSIAKVSRGGTPAIKSRMFQRGHTSTSMPSDAFCIRRRWPANSRLSSIHCGVTAHKLEVDWC